MAEIAPLAEPPELRQIKAGGRTLAYRAAGQGPVLMLLHGVGSGSASWHAQFTNMSSRFRIVAWDAPGYGESDALPMPDPSAADYADALRDLCTALGVARMNLIAHSLGALIAAAFCCRHPGLVARLVLANPAAGYGAATDDVRQTRIEGRLVDMRQLGPSGLAAKRAAALLSPLARPETVEAVRTIMSALRPDGYAQAVRMLGVANILADAPSIAVPTLVLGSTQDTVTPEEGCRRIAASIPDARYVSLPGPGHLSYVEAPRMFAEQLVRFIGAGAGA
jgi:pimeloyl-ACP methyl ester carboxylesterase